MTIAANREPKGGPARPAGGAAGRLLGWWLAELRAAFADAAQWLQAGGRGGLVLEAGERYWALYQRQQIVGQIDWAGSGPGLLAQRLVSLIPSASRRRPITVEIPPERTLSKIISLPRAAHGELGRILEFEIARHFPFSAERVFFHYRVVPRPGGAGTPGGPAAIEVELIAVPREIVRGICDEIAAAGLRVGAIAVTSGRDEARLFLPAAALAGGGAAAARVSPGLVVTACVLALAALASWPAAQWLRLAAIDAELAALKPQAMAVLAARGREQVAAERLAAVLQLRAERPPLVAVLDRLTRALPDGSWLTSLGISGGAILMDGLSPSAATIALALERSGAFTQIVFRSPITRDPATGLEHFALGASLAPRMP